MEDPDLPRMFRLINAFRNIQQEILQKKMLEMYERSRYVYENKQISDRMSENKSDIFALLMRILQKFGVNLRMPISKPRQSTRC
jgi:hypothetical protein